MLYCQRVPAIMCRSQEDLDIMYAEYLEEGYEGQMVRLDAPYEHKRSNNLLKRKEFEDGEFEIVDVLEGKGNRSGMAGKIEIRLEDGSIQESSLRGSHEFCRDMLLKAKMFIGKKATVRFQNRTPDGKLRFPVLIAVRDYE